MNTPDPTNAMLEFFKTLVDPDRLTIAGLLGPEPLSLTQLAERARLNPAAVRTHLDRLIAFELVEAQGSLYRLKRKTFESLARQVLAGSRPAPKVDDFDGPEYDQKVIRDFSLPDGRLKSLPMQQKKFMAVLRYVLNVFEPGVAYPEKQVNEMLKKYNEDTAALRRGLVDNGMLARQNGIYTRIETPPAS